MMPAAWAQSDTVPPPPPPLIEQGGFDGVMSDFQKRTEQFTEDLEALEQQIQDKDITVEDAERRRKEIVKAYQDDVKEMTKPLASKKLLQDVLPDEVLDDAETPDVVGGMNFGLPLSVLIEPFGFAGAPVVASTPFARPEFYENRSFEWGFWSQRRLGQSSFWFRSGLNFSSVGLNLGDQMMAVAAIQPEGPAILSVTPVTGYEVLDYSKLRSNYLELPYSIVYNGSETGGNGLSLSLGLYAGIRMNSSNDIRYTAEYGDVEMSIDQNYVVNRWRYGLNSEVSYGMMYVNGRLDMSPYFNGSSHDIEVPDVQVMQVVVGVRLGD